MQAQTRFPPFAVSRDLFVQIFQHDGITFSAEFPTPGKEGRRGKHQKK